MAIFHLPEAGFWKATPKKILLLWDEYLRLNGLNDDSEPKDGKKIVRSENRRSSGLVEKRVLNAPLKAEREGSDFFGK